jgi:hypothetical protein
MKISYLSDPCTEKLNYIFSDLDKVFGREKLTRQYEDYEILSSFL